MTNAYIATDWKGMTEYGTIAVVLVEYYPKTRGAVVDVARFDARSLVPIFEVVHLERYVEADYREIVQRIGHEIMEHPTLLDRAVEVLLSINDTGHAIDYVLEDLDVDPQLLQISPNAAASSLTHGVYVVPRHELISALTIAYKAGQVQIASDLDLVDVLDDELRALKIRTDTGQTITRNSPDAGYDDIVRALAMCVWLAKQDHEIEKTYIDRLELEHEDKDADYDVFHRYREPVSG